VAFFFSALSSASGSWDHRVERSQARAVQPAASALEGMGAEVLLLAAIATAAAVCVWIVADVLHARRKNAIAHAARQAKKLGELEAHRQRELARMKVERLAKEAAAADAKAERHRQREAASVVAAAVAAEGGDEWQVDDTTQTSSGIVAAAMAAQARATVFARPLGRSPNILRPLTGLNNNVDLNNPGRYIPAGLDLSRPVATLGLREDVVVSGLGSISQAGMALLDSGNGAKTVISRAFAESLGLLDSHGMPSMIYWRTVQHITAGGIVPGQTETQVVLPKVTFTIGGGIELTTDVSVTQEAKGWDLLVSMADIKRLAAMGAEFRPCD